MIVRLRLRAGLYFSLGLLLVGWSLVARATQPITRSEMESFVYASIAAGGAFVLIGGGGLIGYLLNRDRDLQREAWEARAVAFEQQIKALIDDCAHHRCAIGPRNPADSPKPKRDEDPDGFDWRALRGKQ